MRSRSLVFKTSFSIWNRKFLFKSSW